MTLHPMDLSAAELAGAVLAGRLAAEDVAEAALERVAARNPALNALVEFDAEAVRAEAAAVAARVKAGERPPLAGVPLVVKDNIWVAGRRITQGSRLFAEHVAPVDAEAVARSRAAGAIVLGIGACSEFACKGVTVTPLHGATRHPMDATLTPGGSSGGCAAAVAARIAPLALGTDAGGSSRRPAAHCGIAGFKPSLGAIPYGPGFPEPVNGVSSICPIARSVAEAASLFEALAGPSPSDPDSAVALEAARPTVGLRVAFSPRLGFDVPVEPEAEAAVAAAVEAFEAAGFQIARRDPVWPDGLGEDAVMPLQHSGLAALHGTRWRETPELFDPDLGAQIERGLALTGADVSRALAASRSIREALHALFTETDLLLCPTTPCAAWRLDRLGPETIAGRPVGPRGHAVFTPHVNHAGLPAISIPCGATAAGLPLGLQIIAGFGGDRTLLAAAAAFERILAGDDARASP